MPKKWCGRMLSDVKILYNVPLAMRDGTVLYADVYRPDDDKQYPAIINRTRYKKDDIPPVAGYFHSHLMAGCGYNVVIQDVRGTGHSQGYSDPGVPQDDDGYDTVEGIAKMPWCNGEVGMIGESFHGYSQLCAARSHPPHLKAICPFMTSWTKCPEIYDFGYVAGGMFGWVVGMTAKAMQEAPETYDQASLQEMLKIREAKGDHAALCWLMENMPEAAVETLPELKFYKGLILHTNDMAFVSNAGRVESVEDIMVPTMNVTGWNDFLRDKTIHNYLQFSKHGGSEACRAHSKLMIGPWLHGDRMEGRFEGINYGPEGSGDGARVTLKVIEWFDHWLKGLDTPYVSGAPVRLFVMGKNVWRDEDTWPLERTQYTPLYLHSDGAANTLMGDGMLTGEVPQDERADHYDYDPDHPNLSRTDDPVRIMTQDQRPLQQRKDVLVYTSPAFTKETEITGPLVAKLYVSTSARDTDFVARVSLIRRDGFAYCLGTQLVRGRYRNDILHPEPMIPGEVYALTIEAGNTSVVIQPGEAIRLDISSSLYDDACPNRNTYGIVGFEKETVIAHQTILHDAAHPSALILPIIPVK